VQSCDHRVGVLMLGAFLLAMGCGRAASAKPRARLPNPPALASWVDAYMGTFDRDKPAQQRFTGFIGVARDGVWLLQRGYRIRPSDPMPDADTRFRIASISKMFTAVAILQLRDQGRLSLEDRVGKYVSGLGAAVASVRLADLLSHRSGITSYTDDDALMKTWMNPHTLDDVLATFKDLPLRAAPNTAFDYSNSNYLLLQLVIRKLVPSTEEFYQQHVLGPAHMTRTSTLDSPDLPNSVSGHTLDSSGARVSTAPEDPLFELAQSVIRSTANDLLAWDRALATHSVLSPQSERDHLTPHVSGNPAWLREAVPSLRGYGYGINVSCDHGHELHTHSGGMAGFSSHFARIPSEGWLVVVLSDTDRIVASQLSLPIVEMLLTAQPAQIGRYTTEPCTDLPVLTR
jgi:CubicO group peptidase (beta-lactamase class C family)